MNKNYQRGVRFERQLVNKFRKLGHISARSAGSHSLYDLYDIDMDRKKISFIQCKVKKSKRKLGTKMDDALFFDGFKVHMYRLTKFTK